MKNIRSRNFNLLLYPLEDETHKQALEHIIKSNYNYLYIVHDKDYEEETGELKKSHVHCVVRFKNARYKNSVASELGIAENYLDNTNELENSLLYLIHLNNPEKYQYSVEDVKGNMINKLKASINHANIIEEDEAVISIFDYIDSHQSRLSITDFAKWCCSNGLWSYYRRSAVIIHQIINEHNDRILALYRGTSYEK